MPDKGQIRQHLAKDGPAESDLGDLGPAAAQFTASEVDVEFAGIPWQPRSCLGTLASSVATDCADPALFLNEPG